MFGRRLRLLLACAATAILGSVAAAQSVDVELIHYGVGDVLRGGGPVAAQFQFRSSLDRVTEIEAVWEVPNADLDIVEHARRFVLNPGQAQKRWLYAVLPPLAEGALAGSIFDLRLYEIAGGERMRLLEELERHPDLGSLRRWCLATRDAHGLYAKHGYRPVPEGRWMERQGPKDRWQAPRAACGPSPA